MFWGSLLCYCEHFSDTATLSSENQFFMILKPLEALKHPEGVILEEKCNSMTPPKIEKYII